MGNGYIGPTGEFTIRGADVQRLSAAAGAAEKFRGAAERRGGETWVDLRAWAFGDSYQALYGQSRMRQLRYLFGLRMPGAGKIELRGYHAADCREDRPL